MMAGLTLLPYFAKRMGAAILACHRDTLTVDPDLIIIRLRKVIIADSIQISIINRFICISVTLYCHYIQPVYVCIGTLLNYCISKENIIYSNIGIRKKKKQSVVYTDPSRSTIMLVNQGTNVFPDPFREKETIRIRNGEKSFILKSKQLTINDSIFAELPNFKDTNQELHYELFIQKIQLCIPKSSNGLMDDRELKLKTIHELTAFLENNPKILQHQEVYRQLETLISSNVFRVINTKNSNHIATAAITSEFEENECQMPDPGWICTQAIYEFTIKLFESSEFNCDYGKLAFDRVFALQLLDLFESEYPQERGYLTIILHHLYARLFGLRTHLRKLMIDIFLRSIYEDEGFLGIAELLEVYASIIDGFVIPLKYEHIEFLQKVLLPMHKTKLYSTYVTQLTYCVVQFIRKDYNLIDVIINNGILKFWPKTCSRKEVLFFNELDEILNFIPDNKYKDIELPITKQIAKSLKCEHFQIAEKCLIFISDERRLKSIECSPNLLLPIIYPSVVICRNIFKWNPIISKIADSIKAHFENLNKSLNSSNTSKQDRIIKVSCNNNIELE
ncbi:hypothetical protein GJ496_011128 [Pomphorhynchus laevis]|nr:hypothetical protein GJ496_011128 [Pomphorhynchus laevis]